MIGIILTIVVFWYWPMKELRKIRAVKGIGTDPDHRIDEATVEAWKKGRILSRKLWSGFGTVIVFATMLNWVTKVFLTSGGEESQIWSVVFNRAILFCLAVGAVGLLVSMVYSVMNNRKHLGTLRVTL